MTILDFLNQQSGEKLFWYGVVFLISVYYVMQGLVYIAQAISNRKK